MTDKRHPFPPFTAETAKEKMQLAENAWNSNDAEKVSKAYIEAKRELYLTNKKVKEIAFELSYEDEHFFSRFFKKNTQISTQQYRETVGFGRESNNSEDTAYV
jgi:AraC family transcriptional regulator, transcriptional activator of pobA